MKVVQREDADRRHALQIEQCALKVASFRAGGRGGVHDVGGASEAEVVGLIDTPGLSSETINVGVLDGQQLSMAVDIGEYNALTDAERQGWTTILAAGNGQVDIDDARIIAQITAIWGPGTTTRANLVTLRKRDAARAEIVFERGIAVSMFDVAEARLL